MHPWGCGGHWTQPHPRARRLVVRPAGRPPAADLGQPLCNALAPAGRAAGTVRTGPAPHGCRRVCRKQQTARRRLCAVWHTSPSTYGHRRIPVVVHVVSAGEASHHPPSGSTPRDVSPSAESLPDITGYQVSHDAVAYPRQCRVATAFRATIRWFCVCTVLHAGRLSPPQTGATAPL